MGEEKNFPGERKAVVAHRPPNAGGGAHETLGFGLLRYLAFFFAFEPCAGLWGSGFFFVGPLWGQDIDE